MTGHKHESKGPTSNRRLRLPQIRQIFFRVSTLVTFAAVLTSCGQLSDSASLSSDTGGDPTNPTNSSWSTNSSSSNTSNYQGVYSFVYTDQVVTCSDGSDGTSQGSALQMNVQIENGFMTVMQTAAQSTATQQKVSTSTTRVLSSSPITGLVNGSGAFVATGSTLFSDAKIGYIRATYKIDGRFIGSSWSGKYTIGMVMDDVGESCKFESNFSGSR